MGKKQRVSRNHDSLAREVAQNIKAFKKTAHHVERAAHELHLGIEKTHRRIDATHKKVHEGLESFPIVGIGASAGGLEAVTQLLENLPVDTGMAFVLVQHLDPTHESMLASLLGRETKMPVFEARNGIALQPGCFYVIPPNKIIELSKRRLRLLPRRSGKQEPFFPIDHFFSSLARQAGEKIIGIILSGNGSDGTAGLRAIKAVGGITFAQDEKSSKFPGMPISAIAARCVDSVLPPARIAVELKLVAAHLQDGASPESEVELLEPNHPLDKIFGDILALLRQRTSVDFTFYKHATLRRRIHRRMALHKLESLKEYRDFLRTHPGEVKELFNDILIHVTAFFRDPAAFQSLKRKVFPRLLRHKAPHEPIRIWIPGCSTGEEVYSLAILMTEMLIEKRIQRPIQIFGTDINDVALEKARAGFYPESIQQQISPVRLRSFFSSASGGFRVNKAIREICIFARQNLAADPPFSSLDLVSCRNVLIYLGPTLQRKIMPVFHYALRPGGLLMLGTSETVGSFSDLFALADTKAKIYTKKEVHTRPVVSFGRSLPEINHPQDDDGIPAMLQVSPSIPDVQKQADRLVLANFGPAGVIINKHFEVLQFRGRTGLFLEHPHGEASLNLLKMAREGLALNLRSATAKAMKQNARVRQEHIRIKQAGHACECSLEVVPFSVPPGTEKFYLILFEETASAPGTAVPDKKSSSVAPSARSMETAQMVQLRDELAATRESLQSIIDEQEGTNEELRSANEEIMSSNEELQSTNEELETAKEELQSTNEELTTLNDELESRNTELEQVNNDLHNLLASVSIPVIILNANLQIRRFTAAAEKHFNLIPGDSGRPITDINLSLDIPNLGQEVRDVFDSLAPKDLEVQDRRGRWWSVRIRAYKTTDHKIEGAILAFVDIDLLKKHMDQMNAHRVFAEAIVNTVHEPLLVLDNKLTVKTANQSFFRTFQVKPEATLGRYLYDLGNHQWNIPRLRVLLEEVLKKHNSFDNFVVEHDFPQVGIKRMRLNGRRLSFDSQGDELILLAIEST